MSEFVTLQQLLGTLADTIDVDVRLLDKTGVAGTLELRGFSTDTRTLQSGDVFVALKGPNHDAHEHLSTAVNAGASVLVIEDTAADLKSEMSIPLLVVADTRLALGALAAAWCQLHAARRIAITGSNGKTTVKEMVASILEAASRRVVEQAGKNTADKSSAVLATKGNLNNDIGLPLTCLSIQSQHHYAVLEMGANAAGEIAYLSNIARPDVALVNSIAEAHLEGFGSVDTVAVEKASIYSGLSADGCAVIPQMLLDNPRFAEVLLSASSHCRRLTFGMSQTANATADNPADISGYHNGDITRVTVAANENTRGSNLAGSSFEFELPLPGVHNHMNALAAIALCSSFEVTAADIATGLAAMQAVPGRLQIRHAVSLARVIDDTYNANPASVKVAIDVLAGYPGKRVLVLGDMKELGAEEMQLHADAGRYAREQGIDCLITIGALAAHAAGEFGENAASFTDKKEIAWLLKEQLSPEHTVLFKGSRGARIEEIINLLIGLDQREVSNSSRGGSGSAADAGLNCKGYEASLKPTDIFRQRLSRRMVSL